MKALFVAFLALTATATAVEAKGQTKKRGLEEAVLGYANQNQALPFGGPLDLGTVQGIELKSFESLGNRLGSGLGDQKLAHLHGIASLGSIGDYGFGGAGLHNLNSLLGNGGLHASELTIQHNYGGGYGLGGINSAPVSIPQVVAPAIATSQSQAGQQFGAKAAASPDLPTPAPIPPTAFPPTADPQSIPLPVLPPAPLQLYPSAPATAPASASASASVPVTGLQKVAAPAPAPAPAPVSPPSNATPEAGRLGSGSLGYSNLGNGVFALGSGSLGYTSTSNPSQSNQVQQQVQSNIGLFGAPQLGQIIGSLGYGAQSGQNLQFASGYGGQQIGIVGSYGQGQYVGQQSGVKYTSTLLPGQAQNLQLNQGYGGLPAELAGLLGSQVQSVQADPGYGGYSLNYDRSGVGQAIITQLSGLNLGYSGQTGSIGYGGQAGSLGYGGQTGSIGYGGQIGSIGYGGQAGSLSYGGQTGSLDYGGQFGSLAYGGQTGSLGYGGQIGSLSYSGQTGSLDYGRQTGSLAYGGPTGSIDYGVQTGSSGNSGQSGSSGISGQSGSSGNSGQSRSAGNSGQSGSSGNSGPSGSSGNSGQQVGSIGNGPGTISSKGN